MVQKIFCVGMHKCGTTSLHSLISALGLKSAHRVDWGREEFGNDILMQYDAFSDGGAHFWNEGKSFGGNHDLGYLKNLYPDANYILQIRELKSWLVSKMLHAGWRAGTDLVSGVPFKEENWKEKSTDILKEWVRNRNQYYAEVLRYSSNNPIRLFAIDVTRDKQAARRISNFLEVPPNPIFVENFNRAHKAANRFGFRFFAPTKMPIQNKSKSDRDDRDFCTHVVEEVFSELKAPSDQVDEIYEEVLSVYGR